MRAPLRAGIAIYNEGRYHAAHDAWEDEWLAIKDDADRRDDERLLHGLIQFTAAVHHGHTGNWAGLQGLAERAQGYLDGLPSDYRAINVDEVRGALRAMAADPGWIERTEPPLLTHDGMALTYEDLAFEATAIAATVIAEESETYSESVVADAVGAAREHVDAGESDAFVGLVFDFLRQPGERDLVYQRLEQHVARRRSRLEDVDGLFE